MRRFLLLACGWGLGEDDNGSQAITVNAAFSGCCNRTVNVLPC